MKAITAVLLLACWTGVAAVAEETRAISGMVESRIDVKGPINGHFCTASVLNLIVKRSSDFRPMGPPGA